MIFKVKYDDTMREGDLADLPGSAPSKSWREATHAIFWYRLALKISR
jgi:hypothetical protein